MRTFSSLVKLSFFKISESMVRGEEEVLDDEEGATRGEKEDDDNFFFLFTITIFFPCAGSWCHFSIFYYRLCGRKFIYSLFSICLKIS